MDHGPLASYRRSLEPVFCLIHDVDKQVLDQLLLQQKVDIIHVLNLARPAPLVELLEDRSIRGIHVHQETGGVSSPARDSFKG